MPMGLPNTAILTTSAMPISTIATAKIGVAVRRTSSGPAISRSRRRDVLEPAAGDPRGRLEDPRAGALPQPRLHRAVEQRAAAARRERHHDRAGPCRARLLDDR